MLREEIRRQGNFLFRWRSYIPLVIIPVLYIALFREGDYAPGLSGESKTLYLFFCLFVSFFGLFLRALVVGYVPAGTSGRNTTEQRAKHLNTKGLYALVRHPLYLANFLIYLGIVMSIPVWWFILLFSLFFFLYYERIMYAEESFLFELYGSDYEEWAKRTPAFLPRLSGWQSPDLSFSFRNVLKREYPGFFAIIVSFTAIEVMRGFVHDGQVELSTGWIAFILFGGVIYLILRTLKKKTGLLHVVGR